MSLDNYDAKYVGPARGFTNFTGAVCWFNSMLQCFLSCSSFNRVFTENQEVINKNNLTQAVAQLVKAHIAGTSDVTNLNASVFDAFIKALAAAKRSTALGSGQQDASEGFELFLEMLGETSAVENLFGMRYRSIITCGTCNRVCSDTKVSSHVLDVSVRELKTDSASPVPELTMDYILTQSPPIDEALVCGVCGKRGPKSQTRQLVCTPEVFIVQFKKYEDQKWEAKCPGVLRVPMRSGRPQEYVMVAQTEHSGGKGGGHYWARGLRGDGRVYELNDSGVGGSAFGVGVNTYLVWYHAVKS